MSFRIYLVLLIFISNFTHSQVQWSYSCNGNTLVTGKSVCTDNNGNVYFLGNNESSIDINPGPSEQIVLGQNFYLQKLDPDGQLIMSFCTGMSAEDVAVDDNENIYITGWFSSLCTPNSNPWTHYAAEDFDPDPNNEYCMDSQSIDAYVCKYSSNGSFIWCKSFGGKKVSKGLAINVDQSNNVIITGEFRDSVDFNPGVDEHWIVGKGTQDVFVLKLDSSGNFIGAQEIGGYYSTKTKDIIVDQENNIYMLGVFYDSTNIYATSPPTSLISFDNNYNLLLIKFDSSLNYNWSKIFGNISSLLSNHQLSIDNKQNIYTAFASRNEAYLKALDKNGNEVFFLKISPPLDNINQNYYLTTFDQSNHIYTFFYAENKIVITKYDLVGNLINYKIIEGSWSPNLIGAATTIDESSYLTGYFKGSLNAPTLDGSGLLNEDNSYVDASGFSSPDAFHMKVLMPGEIETPNSDDLLLWPNPTTSQLFLKVNPSKSGIVKIFDLNGKIIKTLDVNNQIFSINIESLPSGTYLLHFIYDREIVIKKFIKL